MKTVRQLSSIFLPTNYSISLDLSEAKDRSFSGLVDISGVLNTNQSEIVLHSKDLDIKSVMIDGKSANFRHGDFDELLIANEHLLPGKHIVTIAFSGKITDAMHGLYPCYFKHDGQSKELLATQFESHHAREVFPCVDEPAAKATYELTLTTASNQTVLGNMPIRSQKLESEDLLVTVFDKTPRMSSYLLAFVVGELHKKTALTKRGVEVNVWATPAHDDNELDFGLDIATRTIDFFEEYFGVDYPLPKSDHVALPDFSSGAMENWGLITYRESCLLADPKNTSVSARRYIATVIAHELSHQWFGNLVTMHWWNDLWLNESFANMMEYVAIDALEPDWRVWEDFASNEVAAALRRDSLDGVQPVKSEVNHPDEIGTLFDGAIVYAKGGRLLKMARDLIGDEAFRLGLRSYFKKHAYANTTGNDLWRELEISSGRPMTELMNRWITQPGLPLITLRRNGSDLSIEQRRFFIGENAADDTLWPVPLFSNESKLPEVFEAAHQRLAIDQPIEINKNLSAHFVTNYDDLSKQALLEKTSNDTLPTLDKLSLLQDQTLLARAGIISSADHIELALAFINEKNEKVFAMAAALLGELRKFVEDEPEAKKALQQISKTMARPTYDELGWDEKPEDTSDDIERRSTALGLMIYGEDEAVQAEAKTRYDAGLEEISPEIRSLIISSVTKTHGDVELGRRLLDTYASTSSSDLQNDISLGLTSTRNHELTELLLDHLQRSDIIRPQDASRWFLYLIRNPYSREQAWQWLQTSWAWIEKIFAGDKSYDEFVRFAASGLSSRQHSESFKSFFEPMKSIPALERVINLGIVEIDGRVRLIERDKDQVIDRLKSFSLNP